MATFTGQSKSAQTPTVERYLQVGGGFDLLIGGTYKLVIQPERPAITWTGQSKS